MPLYEYQCADCGQRFDLRRPFSRADDPATCPDCESDNGKRQISRVACFVKGSDGGSRSVAGGGGCAGCAGGNCAACNQ